MSANVGSPKAHNENDFVMLLAIVGHRNFGVRHQYQQIGMHKQKQRDPMAGPEMLLLGFNIIDA